MKKWITILVAVLLLLTCPVTALATEPAPAAVPERHGVPVYGICQSSRNYYEITLGVHGLDTVVLPDGVTIRGSSDSAADNGQRIIIISVTAQEEAEAYAWAADAAAQLGKDPVIYYFAFRRGNGPTQPEGSVTLTITAENSGDKTLFYMDGNAQTRRLTSTAAAGGAQLPDGADGLLPSGKDGDPPAAQPFRRHGHAGQDRHEPDDGVAGDRRYHPAAAVSAGPGASGLALAAALRRGRKTER